MISPIQLVWPLAFCVAGISGDIVMTQSPPVLSVGLGQTATITCTASQDITNDLSWYQQREGQKPSLLIYEATIRNTGVSERFTGSGYGNTFTLTISNVQNEDDAGYYCKQHNRRPCTFGKGTNLRLNDQNSQPKLILLPPSLEQVNAKGTATLVCLANHFYPDELGTVKQLLSSYYGRLAQLLKTMVNVCSCTVTGDGNGAVKKGEGFVQDRLREFKGRLEVVSKVDELLQFSVGGGCSTDAVTDVMAEDLGNGACACTAKVLFDVADNKQT
ncbi:immunoglobulin kappa light chain-like [Hemiscyllium ocellatum]|uniref:immunoglobulin kappa light chain-like n=1 Tax=Hemiscyllium ocellatum TaxID=170820 RepID=UPI00296631B5|nr:immunoglobulin kappa light chain-like [Hemiscyllium ocellatum]